MSVPHLERRWLPAALAAGLLACSGDPAPSSPNASGEGPPVPPPPPENLSVVQGPERTSVTLTWDSAPGATYYHVFWSPSPGVSKALHDGTKIGPAQPPFEHQGLSVGSTYYYAVASVDPATTAGLVEGDLSAEDSVTVAPLFVYPLWPKAGLLTTDPDSLFVAVRVESDYQIVDVRAAALGQDLVLAHTTSPEPRWEGDLSFASPPPGVFDLTFRARDVTGDSAQAVVRVTYDAAPQLIIREPRPGTVARPSLDLDVECLDGGVPACASITVRRKSHPGSGEPSLLAVNASVLNQSLSLAAFEGSELTLEFYAEDTRGTLHVERIPYIRVEPSPKLAEVERVPGPIWDVDADRILFLSDSARQIVLRVRDRASGAEETVFVAPPGRDVLQAFLTPLGAIFTDWQSGTDDTLFEWRTDQLRVLVGRPLGLSVTGQYAVWASTLPGIQKGPLIRRDLLTAADVDLGTDWGGGMQVSSTGDVVYGDRWYNIRRYDGDSTEALTSDSRTARPAVRNSEPVTDGTFVVYRKTVEKPGGVDEHVVAIHRAGNEEVLSQMPLVGTWPIRGYDLNNGWVAYVDGGTAGEVQVWSRSPTGETRQVSFFSASSRLASVGPSGEVVFSSRPGERWRLYRSRPPHGQQVEDLAYGGEPYWIDGKLYLAIGRSLFEVL